MASKRRNRRRRRGRASFPLRLLCLAVVIAGGAVRAVVEAAGIKDIRTKCLRSNNPNNVVGAAIEGLKSMRSAEQVAKIRGKSVDEIIG